MASTTETGLRTAILDAARHLITREGFRDVSMRMIARAVGCSVSSIYLYFPSKDSLIHTLIYEGFERWYDESLAIARLPEPPLRRLELLARRYVDFGLENPEWYEVMYLFHPERVARYPQELYRRTRRSMDLAVQLIVESDPERFRTEDDARIVANLNWSLLHGVVSTILARRLDSRVDREAYIRAAVAHTVHTVATFGGAPVAG
ncbi:MAG TPA: TetR/AcrR family transcriptional regulator [Longimicrobiales bacterium]